MTTNFGGVDEVPLLCICNGPRKSVQKNCLELLADVTLFSTLMPQKLFFAIWGLCWYNLFSPRSLGKMLQFDNHIFSNGWLNHQLENFWGGRNAGIPMIAFQWSLFKASPNCKFQTFVTPQTSVGKTYPTLDFVYFCVVANKHRRTYLSLDLMIPESTHLTK